MVMKNVINAGSIHDVPVGKGKRFCVGEKHFAIFRETYGHFYIFLDERKDPQRGLEKGWIKEDKICLADGHKVNVHTGQVEGSGRFFRSVLPWIENGFILFSLSGAIL